MPRDSQIVSDFSQKMAFRLPPPLPVAKQVQITYQKSVKFKKISDLLDHSEHASKATVQPQPQPFRPSSKPLRKLKKSQKSASRTSGTSRAFAVFKDPDDDMPLSDEDEVEPEAADAPRNPKRRPSLKPALKSQNHSLAIARTAGPKAGTTALARTRPSSTKPTAVMSTSRPLSTKPVNQRIPSSSPRSVRSRSTSTSASRLPKNLSKHMDHYHQIYNINFQKQEAAFLWQSDEIDDEECEHESSIKASSSSVQDADDANDLGRSAIRDPAQSLLDLDPLHQTYTSPPTPPFPPPLISNPSTHLDLPESIPDLPSIHTDMQGRWSRPSLTRILNPLPQITGKQGPLTSSPGRN